MNICVCGWYFNEKFLKVLERIRLDYPITIIANRDGLPGEFHGMFDYKIRENRGLEYGAYDYYLKNCWDGKDTLFMHDDIEIRPIVKNYEIYGPEILFKTVSEFSQDLVYIFKNDTSRRECFDRHGRVMFASARFLQRLKECGGFPWDKKNDGYVAGPNPGYCEHYNWAVDQLKFFWEKLFGFEIGPVIIPAFDYAVRGAN